MNLIAGFFTTPDSRRVAAVILGVGVGIGTAWVLGVQLETVGVEIGPFDGEQLAIGVGAGVGVLLMGRLWDASGCAPS